MRRLYYSFILLLVAFNVTAQSGDIQTTKNVTYNDDGFVASESTTEANGDVTTTYYRYPKDIFTAQNSSSDFALGLQNLITLNAVGNVIEKYTIVKHQGVFDVINAEAFEYYPTKPYVKKYFKLNSKIAAVSFNPSYITSSYAIVPTSPQYRLEEQYLYDDYGNIIQRDIVNNRSVAYMFGYRNNLKIAEADNAAINEIAYTSFEPDNPTSWNFSTNGLISLALPLRCKTGNSCYKLNSGAITCSGLPVQKYWVTYWYRINGASGGAPVSNPIMVSGAISSKEIIPVTNPSGWTYVEAIVDGVSSVTISTLNSAAQIDEVRLYPYDASMKTFTHIPLVGVFSETDARSTTTYYEYDDLNRIEIIRNQEYNIIKKYEYKLQQAD